MLVVVIQVHGKKTLDIYNGTSTRISIFHVLSRQSVSTCISQVALHPRMQLNWRPLTCTDSDGCDSFPTNLTQTVIAWTMPRRCLFLVQTYLDKAPSPTCFSSGCRTFSQLCVSHIFPQRIGSRNIIGPRPETKYGTRLGNWPLRQFPPPQRRSGRRPAELLPCFRGVVGRVNIYIYIYIHLSLSPKIRV